MENLDLLKVFGDNIRSQRMQQSLSQEELASKCGLHRTYISGIECYRRSISLKNIQIIAEQLGVEPHQLLIKDINNE